MTQWELDKIDGFIEQYERFKQYGPLKSKVIFGQGVTEEEFSVATKIDQEMKKTLFQLGTFIKKKYGKDHEFMKEFSKIDFGVKLKSILSTINIVDIIESKWKAEMRKLGDLLYKMKTEIEIQIEITDQRFQEAMAEVNKRINELLEKVAQSYLKETKSPDVNNFTAKDIKKPIQDLNDIPQIHYGTDLDPTMIEAIIKQLIKIKTDMKEELEKDFKKLKESTQINITTEINDSNVSVINRDQSEILTNKSTEPKKSQDEPTKRWQKIPVLVAIGIALFMATLLILGYKGFFS